VLMCFFVLGREAGSWAFCPHRSIAKITDIAVWSKQACVFLDPENHTSDISNNHKTWASFFCCLV
jgi:hypothetical protein